MPHPSVGAKYPVGGSGAIPRKLNDVVLAGDGVSFTQVTVESLTFQTKDQANAPNSGDGGGGAGGAGVGVGQCTGVVANGVFIPARTVVSSIGAARSYELMLGSPTLPPALKPKAMHIHHSIRASTELSVAETKTTDSESVCHAIN